VTSGTTGIAALRLQRKFIGMEIDQCWHNIAKANITRVLA